MPYVLRLTNGGFSPLWYEHDTPEAARRAAMRVAKKGGETITVQTTEGRRVGYACPPLAPGGRCEWKPVSR